MKIKRTYAFAFWTSLFITSLTVISSFILFILLNIEINYWFFAILSVLLFGLSFFIVQYRIERFIFQRIKSIYDKVSLLDSSDLDKTPITSDLEKLSKEVEKFAENKQQQIASLNLREGYRREFLGNISHELKTPLFTVQGYLLTLENGAIDDKKISKKYIRRANKGVDRLIAIVKDLDLISKLESDDLQLNKQQFNIVGLVQSVFDLLEMKAKQRNISLHFDKHYEFPVMVVGDEERIEQVLTNLVVNSIKYGKINGTTTVEIASFNPKKIVVNVKDNGEGIGEEYIERLFERFYRVDQSRSRDQGGSGLGLSIVKHILESHGEQIFVKSKQFRGSEFSFTLEKAEQL